MSRLPKEIVTEALSEAYVNDEIYGMGSGCFDDAKDIVDGMREYLNGSEIPLEIVEEKCRDFLFDAVKNIAKAAFEAGFNVCTMLNKRE